MDQVDINFEWHHGAQFHQGKGASRTIRLAMIPLLLQTVKIDFLCFTVTDLELFWNLFAMLKQGMDQVGINFEWNRGAQFHQGKRASNTIRFADRKSVV